MASIVDFLLSDTDRPGRASDAGYDKYLSDFVAELRNVPAEKLNQKADGNNPLQLLDPSRNTISYAFVLLSYQESKNITDEVIFSLASFLANFDPIQARYIGPEWRQCLEWAEDIARATSNLQLISTASIAMLRLDPAGSTFTSNHLAFVRLCLEAGSPRIALPVLDKDICNLPLDTVKGIDDLPACAEHDLSSGFITKTSGISGEIKIWHVQEYYLLGAHVYIGLRQYERARLFLELVIGIPTQNNAVNPFMVEAYKKLLIIGLLAQGRAYKASHLIDQQSLKTMQTLSKPYESLVEAFNSRDLQKFYAELDVASEAWPQDGNVGIVYQAAESLRRYRVIDLQRTYTALPISRVAIHLSLSHQATIQLINSMISDRHLRATLSQKQGDADGMSAESTTILRFLAPSSSSTTNADANVDAAVQAQVKKIEALSAAVKEADRRLAISKEYADWTKRNKKADGGAASFEDPMEMNWEPGDGVGDDEDIMAT